MKLSLKKYNENKKDLKSLKSYYDKYLSDKKNSMFRDNKVNNNFVNYIGHYSPNEKILMENRGVRVK